MLLTITSYLNFSIIDGNLQTDSIEDIIDTLENTLDNTKTDTNLDTFDSLKEMIPFFTTKKPTIFSNEKLSPVELIDEIFDDDDNNEIDDDDDNDDDDDDDDDDVEDDDHNDDEDDY